MLWNELTFGVEIECFVPNVNDLHAALRRRNIAVVADFGHRTRVEWKTVPDGSLRSGLRFGGVTMTGVEVVSPVLRGEDGIAQVSAVCAALAEVGAKVNSSCGLHVHVGAANATVTQLRNLCKMFLKYEAQFDAVMPASRRANQYCRSNLAHFGSLSTAGEALDRARAVSTLATAMNGGFEQRQHYTHFRYHKLNLQSYATHGTVEFRQHSGTTDATKIIAWIKLVTGFTARAFTLRAVKLAEAGSFAQLVAKTDRQGAAFFRARRTALSGLTDDAEQIAA